MKTRTYKGYQIREWFGPYGQKPDCPEPKYFVQVKHQPTGMDWSPENCPQFYSIKQVRQWINDRIAQS